eukprot:1227751-Amphidinium_carterae.1
MHAYVPSETFIPDMCDAVGWRNHWRTSTEPSGRQGLTEMDMKKVLDVNAFVTHLVQFLSYFVADAG